MGVWCHLVVSPLHDVVAGDRRASGDPDPGQRTLGATLHRTQPGDTTAAHWSCPGPSLSTPPDQTRQRDTRFHGAFFLLKLKRQN